MPRPADRRYRRARHGRLPVRGADALRAAPAAAAGADAGGRGRRSRGAGPGACLRRLLRGEADESGAAARDGERHGRGTGAAAAWAACRRPAGRDDGAADREAAATRRGAQRPAGGGADGPRSRDQEAHLGGARSDGRHAAAGRSGRAGPGDGPLQPPLPRGVPEPRGQSRQAPRPTPRAHDVRRRPFQGIQRHARTHLGGCDPQVHRAVHRVAVAGRGPGRALRRRRIRTDGDERVGGGGVAACGADSPACPQPRGRGERSAARAGHAVGGNRNLSGPRRRHRGAAQGCRRGARESQAGRAQPRRDRRADGCRSGAGRRGASHGGLRTRRGGHAAGARDRRRGLERPGKFQQGSRRHTSADGEARERLACEREPARGQRVKPATRPAGSHRVDRFPSAHEPPGRFETKENRVYRGTGERKPVQSILRSTPFRGLETQGLQGEDMRSRYVALGVVVPLAMAVIDTEAASAPVAVVQETASAVNPSLFNALQWRCIGPYRGGRALAVAGVPGEANTFYFGAVAGGVWKTTDGGATWRPLTDGTPISSVGALAVAPSNPDIIYVGTGEAAPRGDMTYGDGVYKSVDGGRTWSHVGLRDTRQIGALIVDPKNPDIVLVAALGHAFGPNTERGVFRTADGGKSWRKVLYKDEQTGAIDVSFDPHNPSIVYAALWQARRLPWNFSSGGPGSGLYRSTDGGASISFDGGKTWSTQHNQPTAQFYHVSVDNRFPYYVYGAQQDNTSVAIASMDDEGAIVERDWYDAFGGESGFVIADPRDADIVYGSTENFVGRFNRHTMQLQVVSVWPIDASGHAAKDLLHRFNWTSPLIMSPFDRDTLYYGMERLYKTTNDGGSWTAISPDLTRNDKSKQQPSGGPITKDITSVEYYDTIFAIAESPLARGMIWVGTDDGLIHLTRNDGGSWTKVTPPEMPPWSTVSMIEPSRYDANTAYVAVDRHKLDDLKPYIFRTGDAGKTWAPIGGGLPEGAFVHVVREDSARGDLLYAATEAGVFASFDGGRHWQSLQLNLPRSPVHDLVVKREDLVVATHGRSFWILGDVTPLREVSAAAHASAAYLYTPETGYRLYYPDQVDDRPPSGQNPPAGALIDYYLPSRPTGTVSLDILDAAGSVVRHLTSVKPQGAEQPPEWPDQVHPMDTLPASEGMNRFAWNLRYDDPTQIPGAFYAGLPPRGPIAFPGEYSVRLTYNGETHTAPLALRVDPRVKGSLEGLKQKFALSMQVYHDQDALHRAVNDIRALKC